MDGLVRSFVPAESRSHSLYRRVLLFFHGPSDIKTRGAHAHSALWDGTGQYGMGTSRLVNAIQLVRCLNAPAHISLAADA